jgi:hypothetical protein
VTDIDPVAAYAAGLATINAIVGGVFGFRAWRDAHNPLVISLDTVFPEEHPDENGTAGRRRSQSRGSASAMPPTIVEHTDG